MTCDHRNAPRAGALAVALALCLAAPGPALAQKAGPLIPGGNSRAPVSIDASKLDYFDKEQKLVYSGGVVARQGEASLKATTLTIFFNKDKNDDEAGAAPAPKPAAGGAGVGGDNQVKRMEAAGPVTITSKDQVGTGDRGVYDRAENKVYLIGNPVLSEGPHIIRGDAQSRLIYDLTSGRAQITGGRLQSIITPGGNSSLGGAAGKPRT
ncbi:MAG: Organic solvent tolerance protein OstA [Hyphomicrobiales bacterium]|nr:Organic solvent tolerance protein OstA [Hyphomicrobiales bacterium]MDB5595048.1 Organic solvent tolerance protein OstA [Hyphomicrobiales bacterium]